MVQRTNKQPETLLPAVLSRILLKTTDRSTNAIMAQDELETFARMNSLVVSDLNDWSNVLLWSESFYGRGDRRILSNGSKVRPGSQDVSIIQKERTDFASGLGESFVVNLARLFG